MINPRAIATLGIGFGVLALSTIGLLSPAPAEAVQTVAVQVQEGNGGSAARPKKHRTLYAQKSQVQAIDLEADDREVIEILSIMMSALL